MADMEIETSSELGRLLKHLREEHEGYAKRILSGSLDPYEYAALCGRVNEIEDVIALCIDIRKGIDRKKPESRPLPNVED
jgi:hypothetical protein